MNGVCPVLGVAFDWGQFHEEEGPSEENAMKTSFSPCLAPGGRSFSA